MPITRRKRVNPSEQPDNTHHVAAPAETEGAPVPPVAAETAQDTENPPATPDTASTASTTNSPAETPAPQSMSNGDRGDRGERGESGERAERMERNDTPLPQQAQVSQGYAPTIEGGRRTSRGELFRRPPQMPSAPQMLPQQPQQVQPVPAPPQPAPLQPPTHEISLPLGNLLHLAYNPGYTGADEARSALLHKLENESKAGGRARCWNCGSIAIVYDRWATRSKTFGDVGVAFCEICGVWSVL